MRCHVLRFLFTLSVFGLSQAFTPLSTTRRTSWMSAEQDESVSTPASGVVELGEEPTDQQEQEDDLPKALSGPLFISQGEVDPDTLNPDFSDAKQTRVIIYTILSLLPVLFLIPFMLGRDFIPADSLPPVDINY